MEKIHAVKRKPFSLLKRAPLGQLQLHSIESVQHKAWTKSGGSAGSIVRLKIRVSPGGALFEGAFEMALSLFNVLFGLFSRFMDESMGSVCLDRLVTF